MSVANYRCPKCGNTGIIYKRPNPPCPVDGTPMEEIPMPSFVAKCLVCGFEKETQYRDACDECGGEMVKKERYDEVLKRRRQELEDEDEDEDDEDDEEDEG